MKTPPNIPTKPGGLVVVGAWLLFIFAFPATLAVGCLLAHGQDPAGRGIGISLGILGAFVANISTAIFLSFVTVRRMPRPSGKFLATVPWLILAVLYSRLLFTPDGDRLFQWLERISG
jgi:hypothetical protein